MKERPILFSTEMVKAILDGRKTQTRRVIKLCKGWKIRNVSNETKKIWAYDALAYKDGIENPIKCPYGQVGDRLWVRETFCLIDSSTHYNQYPKNLVYKASKIGQSVVNGKWKPSIFMPRKYSRITLEITDIRVERVQDIKLTDFKKEGIYRSDDYWHDTGRTEYDEFVTLWDSINKKRGYGWEVNPYVWVVEFKRAEVVCSIN